MASKSELLLNDFPGILQPCFAHRFRVTFSTGTKEYPILTTQIVRIDYDLITKKGDLTIEIPAIGNGVEQSILHFSELQGSSILIEYMQDQGHSVELSGIKCDSCNIQHDYGRSEILHCNLHFTYNKFKSTKRGGNKETIIEPHS